MNDFNRPAEALSEVWSSLQMNWNHCRGAWRDDVAARFEHEFWEEWRVLLPKSIEALSLLQSTLNDIERDASWE